MVPADPADAAGVTGALAALRAEVAALPAVLQDVDARLGAELAAATAVVLEGLATARDVHGWTGAVEQLLAHEDRRAEELVLLRRVVVGLADRQARVEATLEELRQVVVDLAAGVIRLPDRARSA
jgi:hypothetical protein